jgi:hypothetical protein
LLILVVVTALSGLVTHIGTAAQAGQAPKPANSTAAAYNPPRTPWGDPDLQGHWLPGGGQVFEVPHGKPWEGQALTSDSGNSFFDFFEPPKRDAAASNRPRSNVPRSNVPRTPQGPMIVDPPDGKVPFQPWARERRNLIVANQDKVEHLDPRVRCLQAGIPRANMPVGYNTYQFLQVPGAVLLLYEWNHMFRYVPLDGRPHISPSIRLPMGDSRGRWEGNTLVVDVTNFTDTTWAAGHGAVVDDAPGDRTWTGHGVFHSEALHVVERFTLIDGNTIQYQATVEDPKVFTRPWTIRFNAFNRAPADHQLFEYACHEGNARNVKLLTGFDIETGIQAPRK